MRRIFLILLLLCALMPRGWGAALTDATGRRVDVARVLPAGEPAAVLPIVDYGTVSADYAALAERTQAATGVPTVP